MAEICIDLFSQLYSMLAAAAASSTVDTVTQLNPSSVGGESNPNELVGASDSNNNIF